ncbi:hypothetical protein ILUMI_00289 [Ignelater luminosus]|uniref:DDE Tnp4 domain-containing protein n=1 Tax=Ignelater luminosus TaxID=2038154 RepID=A0A8K0DGR0_IGNLU|nr:hypothetical protein ILUMI_00289 [Ignelater luminosus]
MDNDSDIIISEVSSSSSESSESSSDDRPTMVIRRVTHFVSNLSPQIIVWPSLLEKNEIEQHFWQKGFPGVVGVIDGSHIKTDKPSNDPESYINKKGYYSIQARLFTSSVRSQYAHQGCLCRLSWISTRLRTSTLAQTLQEKCQNLYILVDSGYPLLPNLLTPSIDSDTISLNTVLDWKNKNFQLYHVKLRLITDTVHLMRACCVLHNLALQEEFHLQDAGEGNVELPLQQLEEDERDDWTDQQRGQRHLTDKANQINFSRDKTPKNPTQRTEPNVLWRQRPLRPELTATSEFGPYWTERKRARIKSNAVHICGCMTENY